MEIGSRALQACHEIRAANSIGVGPDVLDADLARKSQQVKVEAIGHLFNVIQTEESGGIAIWH